MPSPKNSPESTFKATPDALQRVQAALSHRKRAATPFVLTEAHVRLLDRLSYIKTEVRNVAVVSAGYGESRAALRLRYPGATLIDCALSSQLLAAGTAPSGPLARIGAGLRLMLKSSSVPANQHVCAPDALPLADDSIDLLWANLAGLAWGTPDSLLAEWARVLKPGGFVMFSALGPDTAKEVVAAFNRVGAAPDCSRLIDMHDWGDALLHAGLSDPVMDMETLRLNYSTPSALLAELRQLLPSRPLQAGLKNNARRFHDGLAAQLQAASAPLPLTVELVFGHAFKVARLPRQASVSLDSLRQSLPSQKSGGKAE